VRALVGTAVGRLVHPASIAAPASAMPTVKEILFVDPDPRVQEHVRRALDPIAVFVACTTFVEARARLLEKPPDLLVTNLRLEPHNGLHLVYLIRSAGLATHCVVYGTDADLSFAREVQAAGALFARAPRIADTLPSMLTAQLPERDKRDPAVLDRRRTLRGGRRCTDLSIEPQGPPGSGAGGQRTS
jgi:DNA-binding NtrC family response regulator